ncbi:MAG: EutN/CcmL family microcompartment protein [Deltaproteobacteria bacterium]|nr:EutN/CcmL family microcompartment protein [Deltaproteobacteria bacterium]MBW2015498.1 EutN/CcmL family microcompartment protein [Deltaproteobacteria bacterium]MBW2128754.1 EutN/CcmL family microcompartment protein [Deltaproteobacteria bacterium]MBW2303918.1 EutN/CcmL family microcompartment protein [Deltaproteobacteria bacterium]
MKLCKVVGFATASIKEEGLSAFKLLVVKGIDEEGVPSGQPFLAVDTLGAGHSELVAVTTGAPALNALNNKDLPVDAVIVAILDSVSVNQKEIYSKSKEE